jgi:hypothetical protein
VTLPLQVVEAGIFAGWVQLGGCLIVRRGVPLEVCIEKISSCFSHPFVGFLAGLPCDPDESVMMLSGKALWQRFQWPQKSPRSNEVFAGCVDFEVFHKDDCVVPFDSVLPLPFQSLDYGGSRALALLELDFEVCVGSDSLDCFLFVVEEIHFGWVAANTFAAGGVPQRLFVQGPLASGCVFNMMFQEAIAFVACAHMFDEVFK